MSIVYKGSCVIRVLRRLIAVRKNNESSLANSPGAALSSPHTGLIWPRLEHKTSTFWVGKKYHVEFKEKIEGGKSNVAVCWIWTHLH